MVRVAKDKKVGSGTIETVYILAEAALVYKPNSGLVVPTLLMSSTELLGSWLCNVRQALGAVRPWRRLTADRSASVPANHSNLVVHACSVTCTRSTSGAPMNHAVTEMETWVRPIEACGSSFRQPAFDGGIRTQLPCPHAVGR
jgi:hypothetical protein